MHLFSAGEILAIGDCNTLGTGNLNGNSYPERVGKLLRMRVTNCGYTMSTSREGYFLLRDNLRDAHSCVIIQFGLVDSYQTTVGFPYILYYPDSPINKFYRNIVKKLKKICKTLNVDTMLGVRNVVPIREYCLNITKMIELCGDRQVFLVATVPHHEKNRNAQIQLYNNMLRSMAQNRQHCSFIDTYEVFAENLHLFYADATHLNDAGYDYLSVKIAQIMREKMRPNITSFSSITEVQ